MNIRSRESILKDNLILFYSDPLNRKKLENVLDHHHNMTLRLINRFVTTCAQNNNIVIWRDGSPFHLYTEYRAQTNMYSKRLFDPFCRYDRIHLPPLKDNNREIETTLGQLNFFRWAIMNNVLEFIREKRDMYPSVSSKRRSIKDKANKKAMSPSSPIPRSLIVSFD